MERPCKVRLAMSMDTHVLAPGEVAANKHLYVLSRGLVLYGGKVLSSGRVWGEDVILHNQDNALPYVARAMTYGGSHAPGRRLRSRRFECRPFSLMSAGAAYGALCLSA